MAPLLQCQIRGHCLYRTSQPETAVEELVVLEPVLARIADPMLLVLLPLPRQIYLLNFGRTLAAGGVRCWMIRPGHWTHWIHLVHWGHCIHWYHWMEGELHCQEEEEEDVKEEVVAHHQEEDHHQVVVLLVVAETATWC